MPLRYPAGARRVIQSNNGKTRGLSWVGRPLACDGRIVLDGRDTERLADADLLDICLRMQVILGTIEMPRCEGRLLPTDLFDRMDTLESHLFHGPGTPHLSEWEPLVREFGDHYGLDGDGPIAVDATIFRETSARYGSVGGPAAG
jgi:hypothetical protein